MPTKLTVFNDALGILGLGRLSSVDANTSEGRELRNNWQSAVDYCFEQDLFKFSMERKILTRLGDTPEFGYDYYYSEPSDLMRIGFINDTGFERDDQFHDWRQEKGKIASSATALYMWYSSANAKTEIGRWTQSFADFVAANLAKRSAPKIASSNLEDAKKAEEKAEMKAKNFDAVQTAPYFRKPGAWASAHRRFGRASNREHG